MEPFEAPPDCGNCPRLVASRYAVVNGSGPLPADTLVVAQNPGRQEERRGRPLYEKAYSGQKLREELMPRAGIDPSKVRFENVCRCRPPKKRVGGDFPPTPEEVRNCAPFLIETIRRCRPRVIITLGAPAYKWFFPKGKLAQDHGRAFEWFEHDTNDSIMIVPMFHPAFGAPGRNVSIVPTMLDDWSHLKDILSEASNGTMVDSTNRNGDNLVSLDTCDGKIGEYSEATGPEVAEYLVGATEFAFDFEFTDHMWPVGVEGVKPTFQARRAVPIGYSVSVREGHALYTTDSIEFIRCFLESSVVRTIAHNAKCEYVVAKEQGITIKALHCTKLQAYILRKASTHLKDLTWTELGIRQTRFESVDWTDPKSYVPYGAGDSDYTLRHDHNFMKELAERGLMSLYEMEQPLISVIGEIERRGVMLDREPFDRLAEKLADRIAELTDDLDEEFGGPINYNSNQQLGNALYGPPHWRVKVDRELKGRVKHEDDCLRKECREIACAAGLRTGAQSVINYIPPGLGLPIKATTDTLQPATDMDTLRLYDHPVVDLLVERASANKVLGRDCRLPDLMQEDGRVHASIHQAGDWEERSGDSKEAPVTGRLSSSGPNLMNIVHHGDTGRPYVAEWAAELRRGFIAPPGYVLMKVDVGQEEPRIGAVLAGDEGLIRELTEGDVYRLVAGWEFQKPADQIDKEERQIGKRSFMAWLNGGGGAGIKTSAYWLSGREAWQVIFELRKLYPKVEAWRKKQEAFLKENGYTVTYFGREIYRFEIWGGDDAQRRHALRSVAPDPIQGTAADILKIGMARVARGLPSGAGIILPVHDELVVECPTGLEKETALVLGGMVEGLLPIHFPLDVMIGPNWHDMEDFQHD